MLGAIVQQIRAEQPDRLPAIFGLSIVMSLAWVVLLGPWTSLGVWLLGLASCALMLILPGSGGVIGVITAVVTAGRRLPVPSGAIASAVIGLGFVLATGAASHWSSLLNLAFTALGVAFAYMATTSVRRIGEERERAQALLVELQQTRAAEIERAALAERSRLAREIHDVLAHTLSALAVQLEGTRMLLEQRPGDPAAVAAVDRAHRLASEGLAEARRAIGALRGDELPGPDGLQRLVNDFAEATGTPSHFEVSGEPLRLPSEAQLALYRTAQEALTNTAKYAGPGAAVQLRLGYQPDAVELVIADSRPDDSPGAASGVTFGGYGLTGMRERAELLGGSLTAGPAGDGFTVRLRLPMPAVSASPASPAAVPGAANGLAS